MYLHRLVYAISHIAKISSSVHIGFKHSISASKKRGILPYDREIYHPLVEFVFDQYEFVVSNGCKSQDVHHPLGNYIQSFSIGPHFSFE